MIATKRLFERNDDGSYDPFVNAGTDEPLTDAEPSTKAYAVKRPVQPVTLIAVPQVQLDSYNYATTSQYGSNFTMAWRYATGAGVTVALVDDGFDPATTATYGAFSASLSRNFGPGAATNVGEPSAGFHGTTTSGEIGATGANGTPMGLAPNAIIAGVKVSFGTGTLMSFAQAEAYAASVGAVVNNSWGFTGYGTGEPGAAGFSVWYAAAQGAVQYGRGGLGSIVVFAAGNDRTGANSLAVQPVTADYRAIAVAATDRNGTVAYYSTPGSGLLVAAIGNGVVVPNPGGYGAQTASGTSYAAPAVSAVVALMLQINPGLGWRDVQTILAKSAYAPLPSAKGFVTDGATSWNGGGMHFSNDLGFGVIDANVAVNLARAWSLQSTSANLTSTTVTKSTPFSVGIGATVSSTMAVTANILVQHIQVTIHDTYMPIADTRLVLISPAGTKSVLLSQVGLKNGRDLTGALDVSGDVITSNAFWDESASGTWTLQIQDIGGRAVGTVKDWSLVILGDNATTIDEPLVYTPEFADLAVADAARTVVTPGKATTIDLIALPGPTTINLNGGAGAIDGVGVTVRPGLRNANADGSVGMVTITGLAAGGSELTGGDRVTVLNGAGRDKLNAGFGATAINTGRGGSFVTLSTFGPSRVTVTSGGEDTIWAGLASASIVNTGSLADTIYTQGASLSFINGSGASMTFTGSGTVLLGGAGPETLRGGAGNQTLIAGSGAATLVAGQGVTTFVVGSGNDTIVAGGITDIIQIQSGWAGGQVAVTGFRIATDFLHLVGFATTEVAAAVATETSDGHGGSMLRFSDNTRLDLVGVSSVSRSVFV